MGPQHPTEAPTNCVFCCLLLMKYFFGVGILSVWTLVLVRRMSNVEAATKLVTHEIPISSAGRNWSPWSHSFPPALSSGPKKLLLCGNLSSAVKPNENLALGENGEFLEFLTPV